MPSVLNSGQDFKSVSDFGNVCLPSIDLFVELLVEVGALMFGEFTRVLLNESDDVLSGGDLVARFIGALGVADLNLEVSVG